jgi:hypothetical protein
VNKLLLRILILLFSIQYFQALAIGQIMVEDQVLDSSKIYPWYTKNKTEYQSVYHFGFSEGETYLFLIISKRHCYAQVQTSDWPFVDGKAYIKNYENLKKVRISGKIGHIDHPRSFLRDHASPAAKDHPKLTSFFAPLLSQFSG